MDINHVLTCKLESFSLMDKEIKDIIDRDHRLRLRFLIRERLRSHRSLLSIAREFHCSPNTVHRYASGEAVPGTRRTAVRTPRVLTAAVCRRIT